jgi:para-aminobenzoate synthetase / 4-amino-4-deoxychorismate lyase
MRGNPSEASESLSLPKVVLRDGNTGEWLSFTSPYRLLVARQLCDVLPMLCEIEQAVEARGYHAAGFVSYEAAQAFDSSLSVKSDPAFPLLWFGLYPSPQTLPALPVAENAAVSNSRWHSSVTSSEYRRGFEAIRNYIREGDTYQVNFTHRMHATMNEEPWPVFLRLMADHPAPYAAYVDTGEWALCSASPELFFRLEGDSIESRPMKGTAPRGLWPSDDQRKAADLRASQKEQAENLMIVDMMRNDMSRIAVIGTVHVPHLFSIEKYPTVWQMTSTVWARTREPLMRIFQALFPPASVTGVPKRRATEIISEVETSPRRVYTGAIGYVAPGRRAQFNVTIRTLLVDRNSRSAEYGVGGGIVWDSDCAKERQECALKARVLHVRRPEFDLLETIRWSPAEGYALLPYHLERLAQSADYFGFTVDAARVTMKLNHAARQFPSAAHRIRLLVTRKGNVHCEASMLDRASAAFGHIGIASSAVVSGDVFLYHKTTNRGLYEKAVKDRPEFTDVLLYNEAGEVTESTIANIAVEWDGVLCTPPLRCGLLPGVYRAWMLHQHRLHEKVLHLDEVLASPRVYLMNAVRGIQKVRLMNGPAQDAPSRKMEITG